MYICIMYVCIYVYSQRPHARLACRVGASGGSRTQPHVSQYIYIYINLHVYIEVYI